MNPIATAFTGLLGLQLGSHLLRRQQLRQQDAACSPLIDLPAPAMNHIIALADSDSRLALFRTSPCLRDAVLGYVASGEAQLQTRLHLHTNVQPVEQDQAYPTPVLDCKQRHTPEKRASHHPGGVSPQGLAPGSASKLLQLAARSAHDVQLHISSSFTVDQALHRLKGTQPTSGSSKDGSSNSSSDGGSSASIGGSRGSDGGSSTSVENSSADCETSSNESSSSNGGCTSSGIPNARESADSSSSTIARGNDQAWLSALFVPFTHHPTPATPLQHVTTIGLRDMVMDHPMPECIGQACPSLKSYSLHSVVWPSTTVARCWPQLQQLTLSDVYDPHITLLFSPGTLPQLSRLRFAWSQAYYRAQRAVDWKSSWQLGLVIHGLREQLTAVEIEGFTWGCIMFGNLGTVCPKLYSLCVSNMVDEESALKLIAHTAPNVQSLHVGALGLKKPYRRTEYAWNKLQHLQMDLFVGDTISTLACLPHMPELRLVTLPLNITPTQVVVGADWLADVVKVLDLRAAASEEIGCRAEYPSSLVASTGHVSAVQESDHLQGY